LLELQKNANGSLIREQSEGKYFPGAEKLKINGLAVTVKIMFEW